MEPLQEEPSSFEVRPIAGAWYPVAFSYEVKDEPIAARLFGDDLVVFRSQSGVVGVLEDRCPHRNVPLSIGRMKGDTIQCAYHGWEFDAEGHCKHVPALQRQGEHRSRRAYAYKAIEQDAMVWVQVPGENSLMPPTLGCEQDSRYTIFHERIEMEAPLDAVAENALDVPHTAFLHRGLFRGSSTRRPVGVTIRQQGERLEAEYTGEKTPTGLLARLLGTQGGVLEHWDRFIAPCMAQVEYRLADTTHVLANVAMCPTTSKSTIMFATIVVRVRRVPSVIQRAFKPVAMKILHQDAEVLDLQMKNIERFGEESFTSTELDVLGPAIRSLLNALADGRPAPHKPDKQIEILI